MKNFSLFGLIVLSICSLGMTGVVNPQPDTVIVPNVEGVTVVAAAKMLQTMGLQPLFRISTGLSAIVVWQDPRPGVSLPAGGEVILSTGTLPKTTTASTGTRTLQQIPAIAPQPGTPATGVSTSNVTGTPGLNTSLKVSVTPSQSPQGNQVLAYSVSRSGGQAQILYQPPQPRLNRYVVADTTPRFYPAWYPKQFLTQVNPPATSSVPQSESMRITVWPQVPQQPAVSPYVVPSPEPRFYLAWYPREFASPEGSQSQIAVSQPYVQQRVGVLAISTTPAVPIPYLLRLYQQDAITAITKAGLSIGNIIRVQSAQVGAGIVLKQSPQPRALVPAGTPVDLWVAN